MTVQRSEHASRVLGLAWTEADRFGHRYPGPEHLVSVELGRIQR